MAENPALQTPAAQTPPAARDEPSPLAMGLTAFTGIMMTLAGVLQAMVGLTAIINSAFYPQVAHYTFQFSPTAWGWIHLFLGGTIVVAGLSLFLGQIWARIVGVILALVATLACFAWLPYYPVWALLIMALNAAIIWALTVHGRDIAM